MTTLMYSKKCKNGSDCPDDYVSIEVFRWTSTWQPIHNNYFVQLLPGTTKDVMNDRLNETGSRGILFFSLNMAVNGYTYNTYPDVPGSSFRITVVREKYPKKSKEVPFDYKQVLSLINTKTLKVMFDETVKINPEKTIFEWNRSFDFGFKWITYEKDSKSNYLGGIKKNALYVLCFFDNGMGGQIKYTLDFH
jgi:hypothetical protein